MQICPKCRYQRQTIDQAVHADICPGCGIVYSKWLAKQSIEDSSVNNEPVEAIDELDTEETLTLGQKIIAAFLYVPERVSTEVFWVRVVTLALFALWGGHFITSGLDWEIIGSSFMHNINLPFHEFGHIFFMPFGQFMMILGGSLFQILLPLVLMLVFVFKQHDNFAGSITLWWCGQSFIDLSPYISDAEYRGLPLVGGGGEESHDWGNLLTMMDALESAQTIAKSCFALGAFIIIVAIVWGAFILYRQKQHIVEMYD
jgi:hypothetical protein